MERTLVQNLPDPLFAELAVTKTTNTDYESCKGAKGAKFRVK